MAERRAADGLRPGRQAEAAVRTDSDTALGAAEAYNQRLAAQQVQIGEVVRADGSRDADFHDDAEYQSLLRSDATGTMGVLSVPAIGVELPIRHGTGSDVLDDGLGHVHGTSLPVGGRSTRTVISGHTNMEGRTLFTRLDELKRGQTFAIGVYGRVLHYRIVDIRVTSPSDTEALGIRPGRDLATLLTCTDTGNTRRLLVTGERYTPAAGEAAQTDMRAARDGALACGGAWRWPESPWRDATVNGSAAIRRTRSGRGAAELRLRDVRSAFPAEARQRGQGTPYGAMKYEYPDLGYSVDRGR